MGRPRHDDRGHRPHRDHQGTRRVALGRERRQRRHQHHHEARPPTRAADSSRYQVGTFEKGSIAARYGGSIGDKAAVPRVLEVLHPAEPAGCRRRPRRMADGTAFARAAGWTGRRPRPITITLSGDWSLSNLREVDDEITSFTPPFESTVEEHDKTKTSFLLTRWNRKRRSGSEFDVRFFYDRNRQYDGQGHDKDESIETTDLEFNQHLKVRGRHDLVWGGGFRQVRDTVKPAFDSWFTPVSRTRPHLQRLRAGRDRAAARLGQAHGRLEVRVELVFRDRGPADGPRPVGADADTAVSGRQSPARCGCRRATSTISTSSTRSPKTTTARWSTTLLVASPAFRPEKLTSYEAGYRFVTAHAAFARRGVVLQRLRRSADDRDGRRLLHGDTDRRRDDPSRPCQQRTRARGRSRGDRVLDRERRAAAQRQLHAAAHAAARQSRKATTRMPRPSKARTPGTCSTSAPMPTFRTR